jgi:hypothetical protein
LKGHAHRHVWYITRRPPDAGESPCATRKFAYGRHVAAQEGDHGAEDPGAV